MPVTRRQFELEITAECEQVMRLVYHFLAERPDFAYSLAEIQEELMRHNETDNITAHLSRALEVLGGLLAVDQRKVGQGPDATNYFAILQEFDTGTWLSLKHMKKQGTP